MAADLTIKVLGGDKLEAALRQLATQAPQIAAQVLDDATLRVERDAKLACPVDTGRLRSSIQVGGEGLERTVSTNVEYAPHVEFGTKRRAAKPFMNPAAEAERPRLAKALEAALAKLGAS